MDRNISNGKRASKTAMFAAVHRYLSLFESNPDFSSQDSLSRLFIPGIGRFLLSFDWFRRYLNRKLHNKVPGTYPYVIARTKCFDERFLTALQQGIPQIVILGAGYDTRAIRYQSQNQDSKVFELDTPVLQEKKLAILKRDGIATPVRLKLCPITFGSDALADVLKQAGYDPVLKTLFMWEGVTYYLPESAVLETLSFIKDHSAPGSEVVFDYFYQDFVEGYHDYYGAKEIATSVKEVGEPFQFGIEPEKLESFLSSLGFKVLSRYNPEALEQRYLSSRGESLGKVYGFAECVHARLTQQGVG